MPSYAVLARLEAGSWSCVAPDHATAEALADVLTSRGADVIITPVAGALAPGSDLEVVADAALMSLKAVTTAAGAPADCFSYILTTDGGSREDASVFYARYLLVRAPLADKPRVNAVLASLFKTHGATDLTFSLGADDDADDLFRDEAAVVKELAKRGITAEVFSPEMVLQTEY
jgi:hypothetical protein